MDDYGLTWAHYNEHVGWHVEEQRCHNWKPYLEEFVFRLPGQKRVLDVGCGTGRWSRMLADRGCRVVGVDNAPRVVRYCNIKMPDIEVVEQDARSLDFSDRFTGVWVNETLMHLHKEDAPAVLRSLHRLLQPSGVLFLSVEEGEGEVLVADENGERLFSFYTSAELERLVKDAGFSRVETDVCMQEVFPRSSPVQTSQWVVLFATK